MKCAIRRPAIQIAAAYISGEFDAGKRQSCHVVWSAGKTENSRHARRGKHSFIQRFSPSCAWRIRFDTTRAAASITENTDIENRKLNNLHSCLLQSPLPPPQGYLYRNQYGTGPTGLGAVPVATDLR
ncbi:hypothetical protein Bbelb_183340 [Branchiostoma belcheri]|nr:hypothetical protein Bbelb_183340 [Branchiostoma belcheri]